MKSTTLKRAKVITENTQLYHGNDFGLRKFDPTKGKFFDAFVAPELGGYQMPGVRQSMTPALAAVMYQQALERGAGPGAVMGTVGGAAGGAGFGALGASTLGADKRKEYMGSKIKSKFGRGLAGWGMQLAQTAVGAGLGAVVGGAAGGAEGFLGGRGSGAGVLGGGVLGGAVAGVASIVPASGGGLRSWPALAAATAAGFIGSESLSNIIKNVESTRKRLAVGGAEGSIFPQGPGANRVG